jgi:hypothetical protein
MAEPTELPEIDLDVADVKRIALTSDPQGETVISFEMARGQVMTGIDVFGVRDKYSACRCAWE